jgi:hypothetical protein
MYKWKCNVCGNEIDKSNKTRHLKSQKHLGNFLKISKSIRTTTYFSV